jgi:protein TonB
MNPKELIFSIFIFLTSALYAQDTIYFDKYKAEINNPKKAKSYRIFRRDSLDKNLAQVTDYYKSGKIQSTANLVYEYSVPAKERKYGLQAFILDKNGKKWLYNGKYTEWYKNESLKKEIDFKNGGVYNQLFTYWPDRKIKRREQYDNSWKMLRGVCYGSDGLLLPFSPYIKLPIYDYKEFASMQMFVNRNFKYPTTNASKQFMGKMYIQSYVDARGKFYKNSITKSIHPKLDSAVSKLLNKLPYCIAPAMCDEEPTNYLLMSAVVFCKPIYTENLFRNATGNDSIFYNKDGFIQDSRQGAESVEFLSTSSENTNLLIQTTYYSSGKIKSSSSIDKEMSIGKLKKTYENLNLNSSIPVQTEFKRNKVLNGQTMNWYENGQLKCQQNYSSNNLVGEQIYYAEDGTITNRAVFENGKLISGNVPVLKNATDVEIMPQFPGGESELLKYIGQNIRYPIVAQQRKVSGKVVVRFMVESNGSVDRVEVLRSVDLDIDNEAVRVVHSMPNWTPGMQGGVAVSVWYTLPITFTLR